MQYDQNGVEIILEHVQHYNFIVVISQVVEEVDRGYRMPKPNLCPDKLYDLMKACWKSEPLERPTFETLTWMLEDFYQNDSKQYKELAN